MLLFDGREQRRSRKIREKARAIAALNHPNIVTIHAVEEVDGLHLLMMEFVDGQGFPIATACRTSTGSASIKRLRQRRKG